MQKNSISETMVEQKTRNFYEFITDILKFDFLRNNKRRIAVLRLDGVIGKISSYKHGLTIDSLNELIEKAFDTPKLEAVCIILNSPGGSPVQSELIANRLIDLSKEKNVKIYCFIEDVAASGGYWLACAADEIYASKSSIIGSIGVVSSGFGFHEAISKLGIERRVHTAGRNKSVLDPFMPEKDEDIEVIKKLQLQIHEHFIDYVRRRRIGKLTQNDDILFNGMFWAGLTALDFGLIDGIDYFHNFIKKNYGDDVKIEYISQKQSWFKKKFGFLSEKFSSDIINNLEGKIREIEVTKKYDIY